MIRAVVQSRDQLQFMKVCKHRLVYARKFCAALVDIQKSKLPTSNVSQFIIFFLRSTAQLSRTAFMVFLFSALSNAQGSRINKFVTPVRKEICVNFTLCRSAGALRLVFDVLFLSRRGRSGSKTVREFIYRYE